MLASRLLANERKIIYEINRKRLDSENRSRNWGHCAVSYHWLWGRHNAYFSAEPSSAEHERGLEYRNRKCSNITNYRDRGRKRDINPKG